MTTYVMACVFVDGDYICLQCSSQVPNQVKLIDPRDAEASECEWCGVSLTGETDD